MFFTIKSCEKIYRIRLRGEGIINDSGQSIPQVHATSRGYRAKDLMGMAVAHLKKAGHVEEVNRYDARDSILWENKEKTKRG